MVCRSIDQGQARTVNWSGIRHRKQDDQSQAWLTMVECGWVRLSMVDYDQPWPSITDLLILYIHHWSFDPNSSICYPNPSISYPKYDRASACNHIILNLLVLWAVLSCVCLKLCFSLWLFLYWSILLHAHCMQFTYLTPSTTFGLTL